jgi:hypothetical protein
MKDISRMASYSLPTSVLPSSPSTAFICQPDPNCFLLAKVGHLAVININIRMKRMDERMEKT